MGRQKKWRVKAPNAALQEILSIELGVSNILAQLLINRGIYTVDQACAFLNSELEKLFSPWLMRDMEAAVDRILLARSRGEGLLVYGDYDVDGITGTTVLVLALRKLGCQVEYFIPHRLEEGYGLNKEALERAVEQGISLVVTVDCGISGAAEVQEAKKLGLDFVITDHHEPPIELPAAIAVLDPKRPDCNYPFKELAGVGVALKLIQGLYERAGLEQQNWEELLDLVCLGTVADIVPLQGENRILVKHGLPRIAHTRRPGLRALIKVSGIKNESISTRELGFGLAPRLNAAGRMGDAAQGVELLLCQEAQRAEQMAENLDLGNQERQQVESVVLNEALAQLENNPELAAGKVLVLASTNWHPGVIGIVASRLVDRFYRPVLMISLEEGRGKGSARSIPGFNLYQAMLSCQEHLEQFGGHAMAAGFSIPEENIDIFRRAINSLADQLLTDEHLTPNIDLDAMVSLNELSFQTVQELEQLSPIGHCNPGPILGCCQATVLNCREVGKNGGHLKLRVQEDQAVLDGIGFNLASYQEMLATHDTVDMAFVPSINVWNGRSSVQLEVKEFKEVGNALPTLEQAAVPNSLLMKALQLSKDQVSQSLVPVGIRNLLQAEARVQSGEIPDFDLEILDYRDYPDRLAQLLLCLRSASSNVVLVESTAQAVQIGTLLSEGEYPWCQEMAVYHPLLEGEQVKQLSEYLQKGQVKLLVTTGFAPFEKSYFEQVIFYGLPFQPDECQISQWQAKRVVLLGGQAHWPQAQEYINALAPERQELGELFKLLRSKMNHQGQGQAELEELCSCLRNFYPRATESTLELGLNVFRELQLLECEKQGKYYHFKINLAVRSDLQNSQTYQWALHTKEECLRFQKQYLSASPQQVLQLFKSSI